LEIDSFQASTGARQEKHPRWHGTEIESFLSQETLQPKNIAVVKDPKPTKQHSEAFWTTYLETKSIVA
jgi:hypothetical protein